MLADDIFFAEIDVMIRWIGQFDGPISETAMGTSNIVVPIDIFTHQMHQVIVTHCGKVVQAFGFDGLYKSLGITVHLGNFDGTANDFDPLSFEHSIEST
jgi:hypothetical protein